MLAMKALVKILVLPIFLVVGTIVLLAGWAQKASVWVISLLMLYMFGCGIYTVIQQRWNQTAILFVAEVICFSLVLGSELFMDSLQRFSLWLQDRLN